MLSLITSLIFYISLAMSWPALICQSPSLQGTYYANKPIAANDTNTTLGWADPKEGGGRMLDWATDGGDLGEPLNVIISGKSDSSILSLEGLKLYANSLGYAEECLGLHYGFIHQADLGDERGRRNEEFLARQTYFPIFGTCWQSLVGGHHFRAWQQNTTGAWFLAASKEMDSGKNHMIVPNGYNIGRDWLVARATQGTSWRGMYWDAALDLHEGLLAPGHEGINHEISQDGVTAILTVYRI